jgi:rubrerythrin
MIRLKFKHIRSVEDACELLQMAVKLELSTLPPYLYALCTIREGTNAAARERLHSIAIEEMIHMGLACNMMNALGKSPVIASKDAVPAYPGPLPGNIGSAGSKPFDVSLLRFSEESMKQGMTIEEPETPLDIPVRATAVAEPEFMTIGEFYEHLDEFLKNLPESAWHKNHNQLDDAQFFAGALFPINGYRDAHKAISRIVSQGEGTALSPLDFQQEVAHYYRFKELALDKLLQKANNEVGFEFAGSLDIKWGAVYPAIPNPGKHDFSKDSSAARDAQDACNEAFTRMLQELQRAVYGEPGRLGNAVRAMFDLRRATRVALETPLADGTVAGPAFLFDPNLVGSAS